MQIDHPSSQSLSYDIVRPPLNYSPFPENRRRDTTARINAISDPCYPVLRAEMDRFVSLVTTNFAFLTGRLADVQGVISSLLTSGVRGYSIDISSIPTDDEGDIPIGEQRLLEIQRMVCGFSSDFLEINPRLYLGAESNLWHLSFHIVLR